MCLLGDDVFVPFLLFAIPVVAVAGGILAGVIRTLSAHRLMEAAVRERMALIARGVDPARIPGGDRGWGLPTSSDADRLRAEGLLVWGFALLAGGGAWAAVAWWSDVFDELNRPLGVLAAAIGLALLVSGLIIRPRAKHPDGAAAPRGGGAAG